MSFYSCSEPFVTGLYPNCGGSISALESAADTGNYISCDQEFQLQNKYLVCYGSISTATTSGGLPSTDYLFMSDKVTLVSGYPRLQQSDLTLITVSDYNASIVEPEPDVPDGSGFPSLTAADYGALLSLVIPSLVIAWSFKMIVRQILNR